MGNVNRLEKSSTRSYNHFAYIGLFADRKIEINILTPFLRSTEKLATTPRKDYTATATPLRFPVQNIPETSGQTDILHREGSRKQRRYLGRDKAGNAATDFGYQKGHFGMVPGKTDKIIHIRTDGLYASLHGGDCIGAALKPYALPPHGAPLVECQTGGSAAMKPLQVTAKNKYLAGMQRGDVIGGNSCFHTNVFLVSPNLQNYPET